MAPKHQKRPPPVGRRRHNHFRERDGLRTLKVARGGGMKPGMLEIRAKDGTIFRVYDLEAAAAKPAPEDTPDKIIDRL